MHKFFAKTLFLGKKVYLLPECHSTNLEAQKLISESKVIEGTVVLTPKQLSGKGQRGNSWESEAGKNLTYSIILKPSFLEASNQFGLHIVCSLAIYDSLFPILGGKLKIKWPNDIYYGNRKLAGILIENIIRGSGLEYSVVGIGLNINQLAFDNEFATSLAEISMQEYEVNEFAETILINLERRYLQLKNSLKEELAGEYQAKLYKMNEEQLFDDSKSIFSGTIVGIDQVGKLLIKTNGNTQSYDFKEVEFLRE